MKKKEPWAAVLLNAIPLPIGWGYLYLGHHSLFFLAILFSCIIPSLFDSKTGRTILMVGWIASIIHVYYLAKKRNQTIEAAPLTPSTASPPPYPAPKTFPTTEGQPVLAVGIIVAIVVLPLLIWGISNLGRGASPDQDPAVIVHTVVVTSAPTLTPRPTQTPIPTSTPRLPLYVRRFPGNEAMEEHQADYTYAADHITSILCDAKTCTVVTEIAAEDFDPAIALVSGAYYYMIDHKPKVEELTIRFCDRKPCFGVTMPVTGDFDADLEALAEE